jgi:hypothetical protein
VRSRRGDRNGDRMRADGRGKRPGGGRSPRASKSAGENRGARCDQRPSHHHASRPYAVPVRELCGRRSETMSATRRAAIAAASRAAHERETELPPASSSAVSSDVFRLRLTDATVTIQQAFSSRSTNSAYPSGVVPCQTLIAIYTSPTRASSQRPHCVRRSAAASTAAPPRPAAHERWLKRERVKVRQHDEPRLPAERPGRECRASELAFGACDVSSQRRRRAKEDIDADERPRPPA